MYISIADPNNTKYSEGSVDTGRNFPQNPFGIGIGAVPFTSPEALMNNLLKAMSNILGSRRIGMPSSMPIIKISMKEYEDMQLKIGDKITIEIKKTASGTGI
jgi:hypothetical protein